MKGNHIASKTPSPPIHLPGTPVMHQAKAKGGHFKRGGKAKEGSKAEEAMESRAFEAKEDAGKKRGGATLSKAADSYGGDEKGPKAGGYAEGGKSHHRMDRPHKASGGSVGMRGRSPFSSAANPSEPASGGKCHGY